MHKPDPQLANGKAGRPASSIALPNTSPSATLSSTGGSAFGVATLRIVQIQQDYLSPPKTEQSPDAERSAVKASTPIPNAPADLFWPPAKWPPEMRMALPIQGRQPPLQPTVRAPTALRPTGPVKLFKIVMAAWGFGDAEAAILLGFDEPRTVREILDGRRPVGQRDANDRMRAVLRIAADLDALYSDAEIIREWLAHPQAKLDGATPKAMLLDGSMERLLLVKYYVANLSGR